MEQASSQSWPEPALADTAATVAVPHQRNSMDLAASPWIRWAISTSLTPTITGTGAADYKGDGGPATSAATGYPFDLGISQSGALYIAEGTSSSPAPHPSGRLRMVQLSSGIITTVAYSGSRVSW